MTLLKMIADEGYPGIDFGKGGGRRQA